jgi:hypothetical protein
VDRSSWSSERSRSQARDRYASRCRRVAFVIATRSRKKGTGLAFSIHACLDTRSPVSSTRLARTCRRGSPDNASAWGGSAGTAVIASRAVVEASSPVCGSRSQVSLPASPRSTRWPRCLPDGRTIAIARGTDKEPLAKRLGAHDYIDSTIGDPAAALQQRGGAKIILSTATSAQAMAATIGGLSLDGRLVVLGADFTPMPLNTAGLIGKRAGIYGWPSGPSIDSEDTMNFSAMTGVRPMTETFPLEKAQEPAIDDVVRRLEARTPRSVSRRHSTIPVQCWVPRRGPSVRDRARMSVCRSHCATCSTFNSF